MSTVTKKAVELLNMIAAELAVEDKNVCISIAIKMLVDSGKTVKEAVEIICGEGSYEKMAEEIYNQLRAEQEL